VAHFEFFETSPEAAAERARLRAGIAAHSLWLAGAKLALLAVKTNFNPAQPRVPAGNPAGGQWAPGGGTARRTPTKKPKRTGTATDPVKYTQDHQADAATVAQHLRIPTQNVLGLSANESYWGTSDAALKANNFFGLHGGANAPFADDDWYTKDGVPMSHFPSYLDSAKSFAAQYGKYVAGISDPTAFAQALVKAGFNSGKAPGGDPKFVEKTVGTIASVARRMK
jgi:hypothetical protein